MTQIYCALDGASQAKIAPLADALSGAVDGLKLGLEYFCAEGPAGIRGIAAQKMPIFLDLKLHDIPNTVRGAVRSVAPLAPTYLTLHASGGQAMMEAAVQAAHEQASHFGVQRPRLLAVTVLTSLDEGDLAAQGVSGGTTDQVLRLARLAKVAGCDGIVASPREITPLRDALGEDIALVVPGIRPAWAASQDQKRVMTPGEAARAGADILVIGRPITQAEDPAQAAARIRAEIDG